jgi:hypothetical protein
MDSQKPVLFQREPGIESSVFHLLQLVSWSLCLSLFLGACAVEEQATTAPTSRRIPPERTDAIPDDAVKIKPEQDEHAPILHSADFLEPVPMPGPVNTAGAEDSPFISPDGQMLFFFFTPDVKVPVEQQLLDGVTGIYVSHRDGDGWGDPERVVLQDEGKLALDGCGFFDGHSLWFCSAREGYTGLGWFKADYEAGAWHNWRPEPFDPGYEVGELHIYDDELYFHSLRTGGSGDMDLWMSKKVGGVWQPPNNLVVLNSDALDGYPFLTSDGQQIWFTRWYQGTPAVFHSTRMGDEWTEPELVVSQFAGEPTLDPNGNLYFVHHFYEDGEMIEADIYVAYRK